MKKRIIIIVSIVLLVLGGLFWIMSTPKRPREISYNLKRPEISYNLKNGTLTITGDGIVEDCYPYDFLSEGEKDVHGVTKIVLGEGITGVYNSFNHFVELKEIEIPTTLEIIDQSFNAAYSIEKLVVPKTVKKIVNRSFCYAHSLKDIQFEGAIELGQPSAFCHLSVESIIIPEGSKLCGAFHECKELKEVVIGPNVYYGVGSFYDEGDAVYNFEPYTGDMPKIYMCAPINEECWSIKDIHCGEDYGYYPIVVPEGEDWKDYKDVPLERRK